MRIDVNTTWAGYTHIVEGRRGEEEEGRGGEEERKWRREKKKAQW